MAGGWGAPITAPMMVPYNPPSQHIPVVADKPSIKTVDNLKVVKPAIPKMAQVGTMSSGRQAEAEAYAAAMGQAFHETRMQNKYQKAKARARGRQAQSAAEKRKRR